MARVKPIITVDDERFRDLNANGRLDPYEDWRLTPQARAEDLTARMTLEEKAGTMMHSRFGGKQEIATRLVTSSINRSTQPPAKMAEANNALQEVAESCRLGIPMTFSTDPRNHFSPTEGTSVGAGAFSLWPAFTGFGAVGDPVLVRRFGDIVRQEYRAVGLTMALSPQADLATEPRWSRIEGTFGEESGAAGQLAAAYVEGLQGGPAGLARDGVACVIKHFAGYGAQVEGWDSHNYYGRYAAYPAGQFEPAVAAFRPAFKSRVAGVMPMYSIMRGLVVDGQEVEQVGAGFHRWLLTEILRQREKFSGMVLSDFGITQDISQVAREGAPPGTKPMFFGATPWGLEDAPRPERYRKAIEAGIDQFGGVSNVSEIIALVGSGRISEARIDESVRRILVPKFETGLFENPYVDPEKAAAVVGSAQFKAEGKAAQCRALVLLENKNNLLPLKAAGQRVFLHGIDPQAAIASGFTVVTDVAQADLAIIRTVTPWQTLHPGFFMGARQHEGDLDFKEGNPDFELIKTTCARVPTIVTIFLDRPAILTAIKDQVAALIGNFGIEDDALIAALTGKARPEGRLPFELPLSMEAVRAQAPDAPHDSKVPLFPYGFGLSYNSLKTPEENRP